MEVFVFFIYKMTLLGRIVGGSKLTPYDSNCSESVCVHVYVCSSGGFCVHGERLCLRKRTSDRATGPSAGNRCENDEHRIAEGMCQKADITLHTTPTRTR